MVLILKISLAHAYMVMGSSEVRTFLISDYCCSFRIIIFLFQTKQKIGFYSRLMEAFPAA